MLYHVVFDNGKICTISLTYLWKFTDAIINKEPKHRKKDNNDNKFVCIIFIPYIWGISEKFKRNGKTFNIKTVFKTKYTLGNF